MAEIVIGVLAIQGAVEEHAQSIRAAGGKAVEIRNAADFDGIDGIILPGGESTTMAIVGEKNGLFPVLKAWVRDRKPIWGTCAGMILLSNHAIKQADGGQALVGGLDVEVCRNYFGSQIHSCQVKIDTPMIVEQSIGACPPSTAIFIRAPAILKAGPDVQILSKITAQPHRSARDEVMRVLGAVTSAVRHVEVAGIDGTEQAAKVLGIATESYEVIVAVQQGNILATAFHPELTGDLRWHRYFLQIVRAFKESQAATTPCATAVATSSAAEAEGSDGVASSSSSSSALGRAVAGGEESSRL